MSNKSNDQVDLPRNPSDGALVIRVLRGDLKGFDELVRRYQRRATAVAYRLLSNRDDAMEVTQDAFLLAYDRLMSLDCPDRFGAWFLRILSHQALNRRRARALRKTTSLDAVDQDGQSLGDVIRPDPRAATPLQQVAGEDFKRRLWDAIDELPDAQRQALILFRLEKMPQKQVAEILECSLETVKWNVFMARKTLKHRLADVLKER